MRNNMCLFKQYLSSTRTSSPWCDVCNSPRYRASHFPIPPTWVQIRFGNISPILPNIGIYWNISLRPILPKLLSHLLLPAATPFHGVTRSNTFPESLSLELTRSFRFLKFLEFKNNPNRPKNFSVPVYLQKTVCPNSGWHSCSYLSPLLTCAHNYRNIFYHLFSPQCTNSVRKVLISLLCVIGKIGTSPRWSKKGSPHSGSKWELQV